MDIRGLIFDVDGTLVNVEERFYHYYNRTLVGFGIDPLDRKVYEDKRRRGTLSDPVPDIGETRAKFWLDFIDKFSNADFDDLGSPFPGVPETLKELKSRGYAMAIVTGRICRPDRVVDELREMGISHYFQFVFTNDDGIRGMNKAGQLIKSAGKLGLDPGECAYVGDWEGDIHSAKEAKMGLMIVVLTGGEGREALEKHNPDVILDSAADLADYMNKFDNRKT